MKKKNCAAKRREKKNWDKNGNETQFSPKKHFVSPLQLIYVVSDRIFHCHRGVMKNFEDEVILLYTKKLSKKGELNKRDL